MTVPIVGLAGLAQSGKDSAAQVLVDMGWERRAFADKLREFLLLQNPIILPAGIRLADLVRSYGWDRAKTSIQEVREMMQRTGVELRAVVDDNIWVKAALTDIGPAPVVVTDVRFPNEVDAILALGGRVFRVERPGVVPIRSEDGTVHISETALDGYHLQAIYNGGTLDDLAATVRAAVAPLVESV